MTKITNLVFVSIFLLVFITFGCLDTGEKKETVLAPNEGIGVIPGGVYVIDSRTTPGSITSVVVKVRNNLGGQTSENVVVSLDNVAPFGILCGVGDPFMTSFPLYTEGHEFCGRDYSLDVVGGLRLNQHGVTRLDPGDEIEFIWPIKTPSSVQIAGMQYPHTLYYTIDYDYKLVAEESVIFMSNQEYLRLSQENSSVRYPSTFRQTSGEFKLYPQTQMPKLFYPTQGVSQVASIDYQVENNGNGFILPGTDLVIIVQYPSSMEPDPTYKEKLWKVGDELTSVERAGVLKNFPNLDINRILYKSLSSQFLRKGFKYPISAPLKLTDTELTGVLIPLSIPSKTYNLQIYMYYQYRFEKSSQISVYPVEI